MRKFCGEREIGCVLFAVCVSSGISVLYDKVAASRADELKSRRGVLRVREWVMGVMNWREEEEMGI